MIVIGSRALAYHIEGVEPKDLDLVGTYDEIVEFRKKFKAVTFYPINSGRSIYMRNAEGLICEAEVAWPGSRAEKFIEFAENEYRAFLDTENGWWVPCLDLLYLLKMSHRYLKDSPHFLKTMRDIQKLRKLGCSIPSEWMPFYEERMRDTYVYKHPKLTVGKKEFFDEESTGVRYTYDHDSLHEAVKHLDKPAYMYYKPEENEVYCDKNMFWALPESIRLLGVLEEAYVLALERSLIPFPGAMTPKQAFDMALMKVCTSITSGWFREFAYENYDSVQELYSDTYVDKFWEGVRNGTVKPFDKMGQY